MSLDTAVAFIKNKKKKKKKTLQFKSMVEKLSQIKIYRVLFLKISR